MGQLVQTRNGAGEQPPKAAMAALAGESPAQYLTFQLGGEMFAVGILNINSVLSVEEINMLTEIGSVDGDKGPRRN